MFGKGKHLREGLVVGAFALAVCTPARATPFGAGTSIAAATSTSVSTSSSTPTSPVVSGQASVGAGSSSTTTKTSTTLSFNTSSVIKAGTGVAQKAAGTAATMTGDVADSQDVVQSDTQQLNAYSSSGARAAAVLDSLAGVLMSPVDALTAGRLLWSGAQGQQVADQLDGNSRKSAAISAQMAGFQEMVDVQTTGSSSAPDAVATNSTVSEGHASSSSAPAGSRPTAQLTDPYGGEQAQSLFEQLKTSYGMEREDFVSAVTQAKGNPGAVGDFMQEKTGNPAIGRDALTAAVDAYLGSPLAQSGGVMPTTASYAPSRAPSSVARSAATPSAVENATAPENSVTEGASDITAESPVKLPDAKSLRERLKSRMAERGAASSTPGALTEPAESLQPLREGLFQQAANEDETDSLTLFEVVHNKYTSLSGRLRPKAFSR